MPESLTKWTVLCKQIQIGLDPVAVKCEWVRTFPKKRFKCTKSRWVHSCPSSLIIKVFWTALPSSDLRNLKSLVLKLLDASPRLIILSILILDLLVHDFAPSRHRDWDTASSKYHYRTQMGTSHRQSCFVGQDRDIWGQHNCPTWTLNRETEPAAASAGGPDEALLVLLLGMDVHTVPVCRAILTVHELDNSGKLSRTGLPSRL